MPKFSMPAFVITDLLARGRHVGRRVALMDSVIAGVAGSVTFGIILGALSKPRQGQVPTVPVLVAQPSTTTEGNTVVNLSWTAIPGTAITYNINRASGSGKPATINEDPLSTNMCTDDNSGDGLPAGTYTYTIDVLSGSNTTPIASSAPVTVTISTSGS